jgi:hypothetical protein
MCTTFYCNPLSSVPPNTCKEKIPYAGRVILP